MRSNVTFRSDIHPKTSAVLRSGGLHRALPPSPSLNALRFQNSYDHNAPIKPNQPTTATRILLNSILTARHVADLRLVDVYIILERGSRELQTKQCQTTMFMTS